MSISPIPSDPQIAYASSGRVTLPWQTWWESIAFWLSPVGASGSTTDRPVASARRPLYIGQGYFDTTLGYPVYVQSLNPTVWVDGSGTAR